MSGLWLFRIEAICDLILSYLGKNKSIFSCLSESNKELNLLLKKYWKPYIIIPNGTGLTIIFLHKNQLKKGYYFWLKIELKNIKNVNLKF